MVPPEEEPDAEEDGAKDELRDEALAVDEGGEPEEPVLEMDALLLAAADEDVPAPDGEEPPAADDDASTLEDACGMLVEPGAPAEDAAWELPEDARDVEEEGRLLVVVTPALEDNDPAEPEPPEDDDVLEDDSPVPVVVQAQVNKRVKTVATLSLT